MRITIVRLKMLQLQLPSLRKFKDYFDYNRKYHRAKLKHVNMFDFGKIIDIMAGNSDNVRQMLGMAARNGIDVAATICALYGYDKAGIYREDLMQMIKVCDNDFDAWMFIGLGLQQGTFDNKYVLDLWRENRAFNYREVITKITKSNQVLKLGDQEKIEEIINKMTSRHEAIAKVNNSKADPEELMKSLEGLFGKLEEMRRSGVPNKTPAPETPATRLASKFMGTPLGDINLN
jgi:hypothetical protein